MINLNAQLNDEGYKKWKRRQDYSRIVSGLLIIGAAVLYIIDQTGKGLPDWVFSWPTLLISISVVAAFKRGLNDWHWFLFFSVGALFLAGYIYPESMILQFKIPIVLIIIGIAIIFNPKKKNKRTYERYAMGKGNYCDSSSSTESTVEMEDRVFINNIFSGVEKKVISKNFKGGDIRSTFGGCEINLINADINGEAELMVNSQFSGVKLMVPSNWTIKSDINCVFAGIEDKRSGANVADASPDKVLVLKGTIFMAGLEISTY